MPGVAADDVSPTARLGLPAASHHECRHKGEPECGAMLGHASMDAPFQVRHGHMTAARRARAWWNGVSAARLGWPVSARDRACVRKNGRAKPRTTRRLHHWVERHHKGRRLGSPRRIAGELSSIEEQTGMGVGI
jgi:hypothetical protein